MNDKALPYLTTFFLIDADMSDDFPPGFNRKAVITSHILSELENFYGSGASSIKQELKEISDQLFSRMIALNTLRAIEDDIAGNYYQFVKAKYADFVKAVKNGTIAARDSAVGPTYRDDVLSRILSSDIEGTSTQIPAADRIVTLNHNDPKVKELSDQASEFAEALEKANDVGSLLKDQKDVASYEAFQLADLLRQEAVRPAEVENRAVSLLKWIGKEAGSAVIGIAALALLALIASFFGFVV